MMHISCECALVQGPAAERQREQKQNKTKQKNKNQYQGLPLTVLETIAPLIREETFFLRV